MIASLYFCNCAALYMLNCVVHFQAITTASSEAQAYFLQGLGQRFAYNQIEAVSNMEQAVSLDPKCAMCQWGLAYSVGPNLNKYHMTEDELELARKGNARLSQTCIIVVFFGHDGVCM